MILAFLVNYLKKHKKYPTMAKNINVKKLQDKNTIRKSKRLFLNLGIEKAKKF